MKLDLKNGLPDTVLARVRKHSAGAENLKTRTLKCHYCEHKAIVVFEDSRGHIQTKCKKCNTEAIYNVVLRKNGGVLFRRIRD